MVTKNTILSGSDLALLEEVVARYGRIVTFDQLGDVFRGHYSGAGIKSRISVLSRRGWLSRIKRELYAIITDIGSLQANDISVYTICQALNKESYISFENALQYHGMFDQMLSRVGAVTSLRARSFNVNDTTIKFFKIKKELYFGFRQERSDIGLVNIAEKEKALLDMLYFRSNSYYAGLVWEKLNAHRERIDFGLLKRYAQTFSFDVIRQMGMFLDKIGIETEDLRRVVVGKTSHSRMTGESRTFNAKWRLYFDDSVIK